MGALIIKEVRTFLGSLIGHIVLAVFLTLTGLFLWIFPDNLLELGYADLAPMFFIVPWVFLFLIPAITMRSFAEEKRTGTLELLLTRPLTEMQVVVSKFLASLLLVIIALLPTLFHVHAVSQLAAPVGNLDMGGIWGSYIGLIMIAGGFVSIGVLASALTENQVVAFILAVFLSFIMFMGFDLIASFELFGGAEGFFRSLGMQEHYRSMGRGVLDLRDVSYFLALIGIVLLLSRAVLQARKW